VRRACDPEACRTFTDAPDGTRCSREGCAEAVCATGACVCPDAWDGLHRVPPGCTMSGGASARGGWLLLAALLAALVQRRLPAGAVAAARELVLALRRFECAPAWPPRVLCWRC